MSDQKRSSPDKPQPLEPNSNNSKSRTKNITQTFAVNK